jgi:ketosteroid isomerase-like protein
MTPAMTGPSSPTPELAIRMARAGFNRALAHKDLDAIAQVLTRDCVLVTGTDSAVLNGRKAQLIAWKREFASGPETRTLYTRTPDTILPSPTQPIAMEHGQWQGVGAASGQMVASGTYSAKWRLHGGQWCIEAEIYLTLAG